MAILNANIWRDYWKKKLYLKTFISWASYSCNIYFIIILILGFVITLLFTNWFNKMYDWETSVLQK